MKAPSTGRHATALGIAAVALVAGAAVFLLRTRHGEAPAIPTAVSEPEAPEVPPADWCAPGFEPIAGGGCFAAAPHTTSALALIVYLHGRYSKDAAADETDRQRRLGARAIARGFAVLALRGHLGACTAPELATWYCWPSNPNNADAGPAFVGEWTQALAAAHARTATDTRFLLGFSNGGYFADLIASRGLVDVDAVVIAHGGPVEPVRALRGTPPLLLLSADDDIAQDDMIRLDEELGPQWPHDSYARYGGHALADEDIEAALAFFARAKEPLPLRPPLPLHHAVRHVRDSLPEAAPADDTDGGETNEPSTATESARDTGATTPEEAAAPSAPVAPADPGED
jgi:predicted esterase